jgi:hypothetical protein
MTITPLDAAAGTAEQTRYFVGGTPLVNKDNSASPLSLKTGYYRVVFNMGSGRNSTSREEYLHIYQNQESVFTYTFTADHFNVTEVTSGGDSGLGTLRYAIANAPADSMIFVTEGLGAISLNSRLVIDKNLTIKGNGVTLTRSASWTTTSNTSQLLYVYNSSAAITVKISGVHFKDGRATDFGAALYNNGETVNLESCVFSGNQTSASSALGGAVYNAGTTSVKGCTFYNNSTAYRGGAIYNARGTLALTGNLFSGNGAANSGGPVVYRNDGTVTSSGYNAVDKIIATGTTQSGWSSATGDKTITSGTLPVSPVSFRLLAGSGAANVLISLPAGYPAADFYGEVIAAGAAAGAVQSAASGSGHFLALSVNDASRGGISASPMPDADGFVPAGTVSISASPQSGYGFSHWLVNGANAGSANPLSRNITANTTVQAVFGRVVTVTNFTDTTSSGSLRYALTNAQDWDIIRFTGVTAGTTAIALGGALPQVSKSVTIEGNGVTLTRSAAWTTVNDTSQLLYVYNSSSAVTVNISGVHFKNGRVTNSGAALYNDGETVNLESCVFSGNQTSASSGSGGAVYTYGTMSVKGCTFYNNTAGSGGAIYKGGGTLTLTGNLFYGNTAIGGYPVVDPDNSSVSSRGYNVVDLPLGTGTTQSGWTAASGDQTLTGGTPPVSAVSFRLLSGSGAANVIPSLPAGYPTVDFYGDAIIAGAATGAVQSAVSGSGYYLALSVNDSSRGGISASPAPDADGFVPAGTVSITASPQSGYELHYWLVNGVKTGDTNPLSLNLDGHTAVQAVFGRTVMVNNFNDTDVSGTLRYALTNAQDGDHIRFTGVTAGTTTIELTSALPQVSKSVTIEGNGVTLTRSASWTTVDGASQLLVVYNSSTAITVTISGIHFKDGRATNSGAALYNGNETVNLETCIFSGNQTSGSSAYGGAIQTGGIMNIKGCTFYNNSAAYRGGAIKLLDYTILTLTGNLFYGNTAGSGSPVVDGGYQSTVSSGGYNVVDVYLTQSGWTAATGDTTFSSLGISGVPFNTTTFAPVSELNSVIPSAPANFPAADFNGAVRTWPGAPGAVKQ